MNNNLHFVAFIDILGFSQMVENDFNCAEKASRFFPKLKEAIVHCREHYSAMVKVNQFSDSIILATKFSTDTDVFENFISICIELQCFLIKNGILSRGGISHGDHIDDGIIFSRALIESYKLESSLAVNPRILISNETISLLFPQLPRPAQCLIDKDNSVFLDYFKNLSEQEVIDILERNLEALNSNNRNISSKIAWLFEYAQFKFPNIVLPRDIVMR